jgi:hypothetical protein
MTDLTPDDIAWLEDRIGAAVRPITPREDFVRSARQRVLNAANEPADAVSFPSATQMAMLLAAFMFLFAVLWRRRAERA